MHTIQPRPDLTSSSASPHHAFQKVKKSKLVSRTSCHQPFHSNIDFSFFSCTFSAIQFSFYLTLLPDSDPFSHTDRSFALQNIPLLSLNSKMLCVRTVKSDSTCFLLPFTAYVFPSRNFNTSLLAFFTSFSIFLFLLPFTALIFSIFFLPIPQFLLPTSPKKSEHPVKFSSFFPPSLPFSFSSSPVL